MPATSADRRQRRTVYRGEGPGDQPVGIAARLLQAIDGGPGSLDAGRILAGGLAQLGGGLRQVEDVVDNLEGQARFSPNSRIHASLLLGIACRDDP